MATDAIKVDLQSRMNASTTRQASTEPSTRCTLISFRASWM